MLLQILLLYTSSLVCNFRARNYDHAEATQERTEKRDVTGHDLLLLLSTIVPPLLASGWLAVWTRRVHCGSTTAALVGH
jgi:hypothetical protein